MKQVMLGIAFFVLLLGIYTVANAEGIPREIKVPKDVPQEMFSTHIVQKGDTLWEIASHYHVDLYHLIHDNPQVFNPHWIYPNDEIKIPAPTIDDVYFKHN